MRVSAVFLDVDGVINDHALNPGMWDSLMGDVLAPALGGEPADWGRANRKVFPRIWAQQHTWGTDPMERITIEARLILSGMCEELGLRPPAPEASFELWREVDLYIASTARAAFPFAAGAIRELAGMAEVHTATGNPSWRVNAILGALGVSEHVGFRAGPDLVGIWKNCPEYYARVLQRSGVQPAAALIVDDTAECLAFALEAGARGAHITADACACPAVFHAPSLADIPALLQSNL